MIKSLNLQKLVKIVESRAFKKIMLEKQKSVKADIRNYIVIVLTINFTKLGST